MSKEAIDGAVLAESSEVLRINLDKAATLAFEQMTKALKEESYVRITPSKFVSFLMRFYFERYFDKDREILSSEFFDSKEFVANELKKTKDGTDVAALLEQSMRKLRRMQELKSQKGHLRQRAAIGPCEAKANAKGQKDESALV